MRKTKKTEKVPVFLRSALWSYDIKTLDPRNLVNKRLIIQQVLNFGTWKQLEWVVNFYTWREIKDVAKNPRRGIWDKLSLNLWNNFFGIKMTKKKFDQIAIKRDHKLNVAPIYAPGYS